MIVPFFWVRSACCDLLAKLISRILDHALPFCCKLLVRPFRKHNPLLRITDGVCVCVRAVILMQKGNDRDGSWKRHLAGHSIDGT